MAFPPNKKPGIGIMIGIGKPKPDAGNGPPPLKSLEDKGDSAPPQHPEPDADEQGGPSDQDADNMGDDASMKAMDYAVEIAGDPEVGPSFSAFLEAMCNKLRGGKGAAGDEPDYGQQGGYGS